MVERQYVHSPSEGIAIHCGDWKGGWGPDIVSYEHIAGNTSFQTWLQNMSVYSAGHIFTVIYSTLRCGSKTNNIASRKTDIFLASAMHSCFRS